MNKQFKSRCIFMFDKINPIYLTKLEFVKDVYHRSLIVKVTNVWDVDTESVFKEGRSNILVHVLDFEKFVLNTY